MSTVAADTEVSSDELRVAGINGYGFISVSRHGYAVLNANRVFFGDIDCEIDRRNPQKGVSTWEEGAAAVERVAQEFALCFRVYGTFAGLRLIEVSRLHDPDDPETTDIMRALGCDPAFVALTSRLHNFRVRLTPKPWRAPEGPQTYRSAAELDLYLRGGTHAVARYIGTVGHGAALTGQIRAIVALHDTYCRVNAALPLA